YPTLQPPPPRLFPYTTLFRSGQTTAQMSPEQKREYLLSFVIDLTLAARAAEQRNLQQGPDFARKLAYYRNKLLVETLLNTETRSDRKSTRLNSSHVKISYAVF